MGRIRLYKNCPKQSRGFILYFPSWSLAQLEAASNQLSGSQFEEGEVAELFAVFGGVPRNVFFPQYKEPMKRGLKTKVGALTIQQFQYLVSGHLNRHSGFGADQPKGRIIDFMAREDFLDVELRLASSSILQYCHYGHWSVRETRDDPF